MVVNNVFSGPKDRTEPISPEFCPGLRRIKSLGCRRDRQNLETLANFVQAIPVRRYEDRRLLVTADSFVQQHALRCPRADGSMRELTAAIVCQVQDGAITRLDEYFDSAQLAAWRRAS